MRERRAFAALIAAFLFLLAGTARAVEVIDDRGARVDISRPPQRIVSLMPALTETVCALGACGRLVGVDDYSNWPAAVNALPRVGGLEDARVEAIVALRPDLVLAPASSRALPRLQALGLTVLVLEPRTLRDVRRVLQALGPVLGVGDPEEVWLRINRDVQQAALRLPAERRGTRVYVEVSSTPYAASEGSFIGELLVRLGAENIVPASLGPFPKLNPEFVVRADPQVIIVARNDAASLRTRPGWSRIAALRTGQVCALDQAHIDVVMRAGPRLGEGAQLLVDCLEGKLQQGSPGR
ncbi:ABC transporter substrate-binding protein [Ramlibacter monticola]|uniref:ABC transporter substrate-binding protein n=1 Tax=Ramlibacter monticola TaxID=1926872 RepID=A0A936Z2D0_9BURK|nr:helical backbone metal receptor [Ramlibacter monticola]MBL0393740.1 ABC transporter substrate-binding protein [Ramlibacter monticola]